MKTQLRLRVEDTRENASHAIRFSTSPVRVGRNVLNDLHLSEPEVSQWHGIFHFSSDKISYVDLGSTNGSTVDGKQLSPNEPVFLTQGTKIDFGNVKVEVLGLDDEEAVAGAKATRGVEPPTRIGVSRDMLVAHLRKSQAAAKMQSTNGEDVKEDKNASEPATTFEMRPFGALANASVQPTSNPATQLFHPGIVQALGSASVVSKANRKSPGSSRPLAEWLEELTGTSLTKNGAAPSDEQVLERVGALLRSFSQAYLELRQGTQRAEEGMGLERKVAPDAPSFINATDAKAMLAELLAMDVEHATRVYELNRAFAELAIHQVALLSALMEGVRAVLESISPVNLQASTAESCPNTPWSRLFPVSAKRLWNQFCRRHQNLLDADGFTKELFGSRFARAYYVFSGKSDMGVRSR